MSNPAAEITVGLAHRSYPIRIGTGTGAALSSSLRAQFPDARFSVVTNSTISSLLRPLIDTLQRETGCAIHEIPDGERYKIIETWSSILDAFVAQRLDRTSIAVAVGGGVVGDITGFAAAAYLRGIRLVQVPTTLLAMVDSSIGGKCGVNHPAGKNLIGAFHQPSLVWIDTGLLSTLPQQQFVAGYAEVFKNAFIGGPEMFRFIRDRHQDIMARAPELVFEAVRRSVAIKADIVERDERETGCRAQLNFGHTFGHALEQYYDYRALLHGEAVLWGIACACTLGRLAQTISGRDETEYDSLLKLLPRTGLPDRPDPAVLYERMALDKKAAGGRRRFVLPSTPGSSIIRDDIPRELVIEAMTEVVDSSATLAPPHQ